MNTKPEILRTKAEQALLKQFDDRFGTASDGLSALRTGALADIRERGLPHRRVEAYKYTDLKAGFDTVPDIAERPDSKTASATLGAVDLWGDMPRHRIVFADGYYMPDLSDGPVPGLAITGLAEELAAGRDVTGRIAQLKADGPDAALDLNTAFMTDGVLITVGADYAADKPIEIVFLTVSEKPASHYVRSALTVGSGAGATILESHIGRDDVATHSNAVFEVHLEDRTKVTWIKVQQCGTTATHLGSTLSVLGAEATFDHFVFTLGSRLSRSQSFLTFAEQGSKANLRGVTLLRNEEHADVTLLVDHAVPECMSQERFKAVIDDRAKGVFQGKIIVRPDAQQTDGRMMTQTLLLSDHAQVANKPELEIFADDVQCAHGATTGQIDEDLLFYLMARGIPEAQARTLLVLAFLGETIEEIENEAITERLEALSRYWLIGEESMG
ncbi:MAG: Fe-S cluster assembly protein SufD [Pseudomonadota bacterium]